MLLLLSIDAAAQVVIRELPFTALRDGTRYYVASDLSSRSTGITLACDACSVFVRGHTLMTAGDAIRIAGGSRGAYVDSARIASGADGVSTDPDARGFVVRDCWGEAQGIHLQGSDGWIENVDLTTTGPVRGRAFRFYHLRGTTVRGCDFVVSGYRGETGSAYSFLEADDCIFEHNAFRFLGTAGDNCGQVEKCDRTVWRRNLFWADQPGEALLKVRSESSHNLFEGNVWINPTHRCLHLVGGGSQSVVRNNRLRGNVFVGDETLLIDNGTDSTFVEGNFISTISGGVWYYRSRVGPAFVVHNTIHNRGTENLSAARACIRTQDCDGSASGLHVLGNILTSEGGALFYVEEPPTTFRSDFNLFFQTTEDVPAFAGAKSLSRWRSRTGLDGNSEWADPSFVHPPWEGGLDSLRIPFLDAASPAIDRVDPALLRETGFRWEQDLYGTLFELSTPRRRIVGPEGGGAVVDVGAVERQPMGP